MIGYTVQKAWFRNRWHVYTIGHTEGDYLWLATFRNQLAAEHWASTGKPRSDASTVEPQK